MERFVMSIHITPVKTETYIPSKVKDEERKPEEKPMYKTSDPASKHFFISSLKCPMLTAEVLALFLPRSVSEPRLVVCLKRWYSR